MNAKSNKALLIALALIFGLAGATWAASVTPEVVAGNPVCTCGQWSFKIDANPPVGSYTDTGSGGGTFWITATDGTTFSWEANRPVCAVIVKGGTEGANVYSYPNPVWSDTNLTTPTGQDISHVTFCYDDANPEIDIEKATNGYDADDPTGPYILAGSTVAWTYVVTNTGNTPLTNITVTDDQGVAVTLPKTTLEPGESMTGTGSGTAAAGQYANLASVVGSPPFGLGDVTDADPSHYFGADPSIDIEKATNGEDADTPTGPIILFGNAVTWTYVVTNTGNVLLTNVQVTDVPLGAIDTIGSLAPGESATLTATRTAEAGQYANTGTAKGTPPVGPNVEDSDPSHYFGANPVIEIEKYTCEDDADDTTGPEIVVGYEVPWKYVVTNKGNVDLANVVVLDLEASFIGPIGSLAAGASTTLDWTGTAVAGQHENEGVVAGEYIYPDGTVDVSHSDFSHYYGVSPDFTVSKACSNTGGLVPPEGPCIFLVTFKNTGDVPLSITADDGIGTFDLAAGGNETFEVSVPGPFFGVETVSNSVTATGSYTDGCGHAWALEQSDGDTCYVAGRVKVLKLTNDVVDPTKTWIFKIIKDGTVVATDSTAGDPDGILDFDNYNLDPQKKYILMESEIAAGYSSLWQVDTDCDGIGDSIVVPYNPDADTGEDLGNRAVDIGADTSTPPLSIPGGGTLCFVVNNLMPGGEARTPGYWKNWNWVSGGGQAITAANNGGWEEGFWLLEDVLDPDIGGGVILACECITDASLAVSILDQRDFSTGKKVAKDPAYTLAMHLLAYQLNQGAGAYAPSETTLTAALEAEALLCDLSFNGTGGYLSSKDDLSGWALELAEILDKYNNNNEQ